MTTSYQTMPRTAAIELLTALEAAEQVRDDCQHRAARDPSDITTMSVAGHRVVVRVADLLPAVEHTIAELRRQLHEAGYSLP